MHILRTALCFLAFALASAVPAPQPSQNSPVLGADIPSYPPLARGTYIQGKVEIQIQMGSDGKVISATSRSGHPLLLQAALDNVKTWRFAPRQGEQIVVYEFRIDDKKVDENDPYYRYGKVLFRPPNTVEVIVPPLIMVAN